MKNYRFNDTVKSIGNQRFELAILRDQDDMYTIAYNIVYDERTHYSEQIQDYKMASYMFDLKLSELEGQ